MIVCPKCNAENNSQNLRCDHCDEWLIFYEFENKKRKKTGKPKKEHKEVFLPDTLVSDETADEQVLTGEMITRFGLETDGRALKPDDAVVEKAFSPECPYCGGEVKTYEVRCRHCNNMLKEKLEVAQRMKPYWESIYKDKVLSEGGYDDIYSKGEVGFIFKKMMSRGNKMMFYVFFMFIFILVMGAMLFYCANTMTGL